MHYTLKDMARLAGLNERTVLTYMQRTGRRAAAPTTKRRSWQFSEDDLDAVLHLKREVEQERTRTAHAAYTQSTDITDLAARLAAVEEQLAALREHSPWLFSRVARSAPNLSEHVAEAIQAPRRLASATTARHISGGEGTLPAGLVSAPAFAKAHGMRESQRTTWRKAVDRGRLPAQHNAEGWLYDGVRVEYALDAEGRRVFCALWHNAPWFTSCEECPHE